MRRPASFLLAATGAALVLVPFCWQPASAATATANLSISATVTNNCTIGTSPVAFGSYDPVVTNAATPLDATGTVTVTCTQGTSRVLGLDLGSYASGANRRLSDGGTNYITYELYKESSRSNVWGNSGANLLTPPVDPAASNAAVNLTVYGRIPAAQNVVAGNYTDTVVATVTF